LPPAMSIVRGGSATSSPRHSRARSAAVSGGSAGSSISPSLFGAAGCPGTLGGRGRLRFLGRDTPASGATTTTGGPGDCGAIRDTHGGRSTRYIAPAPSATPMTSPIEPRTASLYHGPRAPAVEPAAAAAIVAIAVASYLAVMTLVPQPLNFVLAQLALVAVAGVAAAIAHPARPLAALGLRGARPRYFVAAIAIGATAWYLNAWLVAWLVERFALPREQIQHLKGLVDRPEILPAVAAFALLPAVCEELVFRGVLARSLGRRQALAVAAAISALVFSAYHLSPVQALPTFTLGVVLGAIAIRADSVLPT